jgi:hypothetical protein
MRKLSLLFVMFLLLLGCVQAQKQFQGSLIDKMRWGRDFKLYLELNNDSNYIMDIKELHHVNTENNKDGDDFTYYPVRLDPEFVKKLKAKSYASQRDTVIATSNKTLWSSLHGDIGGGWVHFINCMLYSLETQQLRLTAPLMKRPESDWKPRPITESYRRTRRWDYYVPVDQKMAQKEYQKRQKEGDLSDLHDVPKRFTQIFLETSRKEYQQIQDKKKKAQIDLIKLLLGAKYLGETQITYIRSSVLKATSKYAENQLPSVIILDNFRAAVAMSLNESGYHVEKIVFSDHKQLDDYERRARESRIHDLIAHINKANQEVFQKKLRQHYQ